MYRAFKETFTSLQSAATATLDVFVFSFEADNVEVKKNRQSLSLAQIKIKACFERYGVSSSHISFISSNSLDHDTDSP